jgi:2-methylcitrate dehydratase PrpD
MSEERDLVKFCTELTFDDLSDTIVDHTKLVIMDSIGVIVSGFNANPVYKKWAEKTKKIAPGRATILGVSIKAEEAYAALANGIAGSSLELDEGNRFCGGHPSMHVIPAALALSEKEGLSGKEFIAAIVAGYEIAARIGRAISPLRKQFHPHGTWGVVGAAVASAKLLRLDVNQTYQAASVASNYSLNTSFDTPLEGATVRDSYCGLSNFLGILSSRLSQTGFTGLDDGIARHFAHLGQNVFQYSCIVDFLSERFEITRNYFKVHAACRYTHGALDALDEIIASHGPIVKDEITKIEVETYNIAACLSNSNPKNALQAKFSIPYAIAARLFYGTSDIEAFKAESITEKALQIAQKVSVSENPKFSAQLPDKRPTQVIVSLKTGGKLSSLIDVPKGDYSNPYTPQILKEKFIALVSPIIGTKKGKESLKAIETIEKIENMKNLTRILS